MFRRMRTYYFTSKHQATEFILFLKDHAESEQEFMFGKVKWTALRKVTEGFRSGRVQTNCIIEDIEERNVESAHSHIRAFYEGFVSGAAYAASEIDELMSEVNGHVSEPSPVVNSKSAASASAKGHRVGRR